MIPGPRWNSIDAFLDDLPRRHCSVKPADNFCSVCIRINNEVAFDCPLRFPSYELPPGMRPAPAPIPPQWRPPPMPGHAAPAHHAPPPPPPTLAQGPVIEFARQTEPHQAPKRMKAKAVSKRGDARPAPPPPPPSDADFEFPRAAPADDHPHHEGHEHHHGEAAPPPPSEEVEAPDDSSPRKRFRQR